jgi:hypothetical protein
VETVGICVDHLSVDWFYKAHDFDNRRSLEPSANRTETWVKVFGGDKCFLVEDLKFDHDVSAKGYHEDVCIFLLRDAVLVSTSPVFGRCQYPGR